MMLTAPPRQMTEEKKRKGARFRLSRLNLDSGPTLRSRNRDNPPIFGAGAAGREIASAG